MADIQRDSEGYRVLVPDDLANDELWHQRGRTMALRPSLPRALRFLVEQIEACDYQCDAGPLAGNVAWRRVRELAGLESEAL